ncbi:uncharacterized protein LOC144665202 [Oculina patagonica]
MSDNQQLSMRLFFTVVVFLCARISEAQTFKAGKENVTTIAPGLFACKRISFQHPFHGGQQIKVFASIGHTVKSSFPRNSAAIWIQSVTTSGFKVCVLKYGKGSNESAEVNWVSFRTVSARSQLGNTSFNSLTTGTECKTIGFKKRFSSPPAIFVTASHQVAKGAHEAIVLWVENFSEGSFTICVREAKMFDGPHNNINIDWMAFNDLRVDNFTITDSLVFKNTTSPSHKNNFAFCQTITFTNPFYAPPVVMVTPKHSYSNNYSHLPGSQCNAVTAWVEHTSTEEAKVCIRNYNGNKKSTFTVDYMVIGDLDQCLNVTCDYHGLCKAFGPHDARCVCMESCPSYQEPVCSSNGTTYDNECLFQQEMCLLQQNFSVQHPGSCEGFPFQRGRRHMPHIPSLGYSHCEVIRLKPYVFYPDKPLEVQITVNHIDTSDKSYVHDAAVSWVENVDYDRFTACVMAAGFNERKSHANVTVDWMTYQGAPVGGVAGEVRISQWWTGTTCKAVNFPSGKFSVIPSVFVTAAHHHAGLKRDAASVWIEDVTQSSFKVCLRELQNYAGSHEDVYVKWLAFSSLHKPLFSEHNSVYFANSQHPPADYNNAYCKDVRFTKNYNSTSNVFVSANHSSGGGNQQPEHNGIAAWVEYINNTGFRVCLKELYETKYEPLSISYTVLSDVCRPGWNYFAGYCYFASPICASWLNAESNCSAMNSDLVTVHNQQENVYIQHQHNGDRSWLGLNDRSVEGSFAWTNKQLSSFRFWAPKQANDWNNEDCVHTLGARHGYTWNDVPCDNCFNYTCFTDLDECSTHTYTCDVNADCTNTVGSYSCSCKTGYTGDGQTCMDIDECSSNSHSCDVNAVCSNNHGSHTCTCKVGYSGDGKSCTDIDECVSGVHDCHSSASCTNTVGSFTCSCNQPYTGDGKTCNLVAGCQNYQSLSGADRKINYYSGSYCDSGIGPGWFRFQGGAGTRMPTSCPPTYRCDTSATGWLNGGHPTVADGQVTRQACFHWSSNCCYWSTNIQVRNCGSFYVYYFNGTPNCQLRYCGTD